MEGISRPHSVIGGLYIGRQNGVGKLTYWGKDRRKKEETKGERDGERKEKREVSDEFYVYFVEENSIKKAM